MKKNIIKLSFILIILLTGCGKKEDRDNLIPSPIVPVIPQSPQETIVKDSIEKIKNNYLSGLDDIHQEGNELVEKELYNYTSFVITRKITYKVVENKFIINFSEIKEFLSNEEAIAKAVFEVSENGKISIYFYAFAENEWHLDEESVIFFNNVNELIDKTNENKEEMTPQSVKDNINLIKAFFDTKLREKRKENNKWIVKDLDGNEGSLYYEIAKNKFVIIIEGELTTNRLVINAHKNGTIYVSKQKYDYENKQWKTESHPWPFENINEFIEASEPWEF